MCRLHYLMFETPRRSAVERFYREQVAMVPRPLKGDHGDRRAASILRLRARGRQLMFVEGAGTGLLEAGFVVESESQWRRGAALLRRIAVPEIIVSPLYDEPALAIRDSDGNRLCFGLRRPARLAADERALPMPAAGRRPLPGRLQHFGFGTAAVETMTEFYLKRLCFALSDQVFSDDGLLRSTFVRSDAEHHSVAVFGNGTPGFDHFSLEAPGWTNLRDWADHFAGHGTTIAWGPGRHGVGNNLFLFVHDPDRRMLEISAELDRIKPSARPGRWKFDHRAYNLWGPAPLRV